MNRGFFGPSHPSPVAPWMLFDQQIITTAQLSFVTARIPQTCRHLRVEVHGRCDTAQANDVLNIRFNADAGSNYIYEYIYAVQGGTSLTNSASATGVLCGILPAASATANFAGQLDADVPNYRCATLFKSLNARSALFDGSNYITMMASGVWKSLAPITGLTVYTASGGKFVAGSIYSLYGIGS